MYSKDYRLNSYDKAAAERTLEMHLNSGRLSAENYTSKKLLIAVAEYSHDLEKIFADVGGSAEKNYAWQSQLKRHGRQIEVLDILSISGYILFIAALGFFLHVQWIGLLFLGFFFIPMIPRVLVDLSTQEELLYYEIGMNTKK